MRRIGLTGNIGSGKTTICRLFEMLGIPVFYADIHARKQLLYADVIEQLVGAFGSEILDSRHQIIRKKLAAIVFNDGKALQLLNAIIHPLVRKEYTEWEACQNSPYTIQEAAILYESGMSDLFEKVILVTAPAETRIERVCQRDHATRNEVLARMNNQMPEEVLMGKADFEILNDGNTLVIPQVIEIDRQLRNL